MGRPNTLPPVTPSKPVCLITENHPEVAVALTGLVLGPVLFFLTSFTIQRTSCWKGCQRSVSRGYSGRSAVLAGAMLAGAMLAAFCSEMKETEMVDHCRRIMKREKGETLTFIFHIFRISVVFFVT